MEIVKGSRVLVTVDPEFRTRGDANTVWVDYSSIARVVPVGGRIYIDDGLISLVVKKIGANEPPALVLRSGPSSFRSRLRPLVPPHLPESRASRLLGYPGLGLDWRVRSFFHRRPPCAIRCRAQTEHEETNKTSFRFLVVQAWCSHSCDYAPASPLT